MIVCVGHLRPFESLTQVYIELYNEFSTLILVYHLMCFTNFVPDVDTREVVGSSMIYTTMFNLSVNLLIIAKSVGGHTFNKAKLRF